MDEPEPRTPYDAQDATLEEAFRCEGWRIAAYFLAALLLPIAIGTALQNLAATKALAPPGAWVGLGGCGSLIALVGLFLRLHSRYVGPISNIGWLVAATFVAWSVCAGIYRFDVPMAGKMAGGISAAFVVLLFVWWWPGYLAYQPRTGRTLTISGVLSMFLLILLGTLLVLHAAAWILDRESCNCLLYCGCAYTAVALRPVGTQLCVFPQAKCVICAATPR